MKLRITRDQDKSFLGGMSFIISAKLLPSDAEAEAIAKYRPGDIALLEFQDGSKVTVKELMAGWSQQAKEINLLLSNEKLLVEASREFQSVLELMQKHVGEDRRELAPGMTVFIARRQGTKLFGGIKFAVSAKVELSNELVALVDRYKMRKELLSAAISEPVTVGGLMDGVVVQGSPEELATLESRLIEACGVLKLYLDATSAFGGESRTTLANGVTLVTKREQSKGLLGGVSFMLNSKLELSAEVAALVEKYKAHKAVLAQRGSDPLTATHLIKGVSEKCKDVSVLLENEKVIHHACQAFVEQVAVMASFGGSVTIDLEGDVDS